MEEIVELLVRGKSVWLAGCERIDAAPATACQGSLSSRTKAGRLRARRVLQIGYRTYDFTSDHDFSVLGGGPNIPVARSGLAIPAWRQPAVFVRAALLAGANDALPAQVSLEIS